MSEPVGIANLHPWHGCMRLDSGAVVRGHSEAQEEGWAVAQGHAYLYRVRPEAGKFVAERRALDSTAWLQIGKPVETSWLGSRACDALENPPAPSERAEEPAQQPVERMSAVERARQHRARRK